MLDILYSKFWAATGLSEVSTDLRTERVEQLLASVDHCVDLTARATEIGIVLLSATAAKRRT